MHDLLDKAMLECWRHFVLACRVLLMNTISVSSINKTWSVTVLQRTETLFGKSIITPNMHNAPPPKAVPGRLWTLTHILAL